MRVDPIDSMDMSEIAEIRPECSSASATWTATSTDSVELGHRCAAMATEVAALVDRVTAYALGVGLPGFPLPAELSRANGRHRTCRHTSNSSATRRNASLHPRARRVMPAVRPPGCGPVGPGLSAEAATWSGASVARTLFVWRASAREWAYPGLS